MDFLKTVFIVDTENKLTVTHGRGVGGWAKKDQRNRKYELPMTKQSQGEVQHRGYSHHIVVTTNGARWALDLWG